MIARGNSEQAILPEVLRRALAAGLVLLAGAAAPGCQHRSDAAAEYESLAMVLFGLGDAWAAKNTEGFLEYFAERYADKDVQGKDGMRMRMEELGRLGEVTIDTYKARLEISGNRATASPIEVRLDSSLIASVAFTFTKEGKYWRVISMEDLLEEAGDARDPEEVRAGEQTPLSQF